MTEAHARSEIELHARSSNCSVDQLIPGANASWQYMGQQPCFNAFEAIRRTVER